MAERYKALLLFGAPGVGKGTQGRLLGQIPGMRHVATGEMFRALDRQSPLGRKVNEYSSRGELVPDDLTIELWKQHVRGLIESGKFSPADDLLVLDGIPRSVNQAKAIDPHIDVLGVVHLATPNIDEMVGRMKLRAQREKRHDDADEAVIRRRFAVFDAETKPVLKHYKPKLIKKVKAVGTPAEVLMKVLEAVVPLYKKHFGNPLE
ncbi:MAG: nucleoside monophosphate kinase [Phycisphaerales bacterium]|nr:nucleoside monophosphate kinase [Phycisphaerales bacterium]MCI0629362.1 nucleoside monophosphate kinase [Phycisphaerales bacterium]MCI0674550.1 nucleoside monophosphate kinase [Phycisphaerales bacterium]